MALLPRLLAFLGLVLPLVLAQGPPLPLSSSSRWILDANGERVKFRCVNWAGHMEANVPEGLHRQSMDYIVGWIKQQGFNCVRLTYSTDMALNPNLRVADSFTAAATAANVPLADMTRIYGQITEKNPWIANSTTRDVFGTLIDKLWGVGIMTILDNHVSKAGWCCNIDDGNGWWDEAFGYNHWNSRFFKTRDWLAGLKAMALWSKASHPGVVGMGLRNELRAFLLQDLNGREDWYKFVKQAGDLVHAAHPDTLILVGGAQSSTDLAHLRARMLDTSGWAGKNVWEMHAYSFTITFPDAFKNCDIVKAQYGAWIGFVLEQNRPYTGPMILGEFGVGMGPGGDSTNGLGEQDARYLSCLVSYMTNNDAEWAVWVLGGSYYIRQGNVDHDESYGLLTHDWSTWRNPAFPGMLGDMWKVTQGPGKRRVR